jgi:hypothetical protein
VAAATDRLISAVDSGDDRRYADDDLYRYAIASLCCD